MIAVVSRSLVLDWQVNVENLCYIVHRCKKVSVEFASGCLKTLIEVRGESLLAEELCAVIRVGVSMMSCKEYVQDRDLERLFEKRIVEEKVLRNVNFDPFVLKGCFFDFLKLCH